MNQAGVTLSRNTVEAFEAIAPGRGVKKWLSEPTGKVPFPIRTKLGKILSRFEGGWSTFIDEIKISQTDRHMIYIIECKTRYTIYKVKYIFMNI